jgi:hypothetical protein
MTGLLVDERLIAFVTLSRSVRVLTELVAQE